MENQEGKPEGLHSYRVFNISIVDVFLYIVIGKVHTILHNGGNRIQCNTFCMLHSRYNNS